MDINIIKKAEISTHHVELGTLNNLIKIALIKNNIKGKNIPLIKTVANPKIIEPIAPIL